MTDGPTNAHTDDGTEILDDAPAYAARVEEHREALTEIAASGGPDAYVARILLARAEGREPDSADLARLTRADTRQGELSPDAFRSPSERFEQATRRLFDRLESAGRNANRDAA